MIIYHLKNKDGLEIVRFILGNHNNIIVSNSDQKTSEDMSGMIESIFADGVLARRPERVEAKDGEHLLTVLKLIAKDDEYYSDAVVEHLEREGFVIEKEEAPSEIQEVIKELKKLDLGSKTQVQALTLVTFSNKKDIKKLLKELRS